MKNKNFIRVTKIESNYSAKKLKLLNLKSSSFKRFAR